MRSAIVAISMLLLPAAGAHEAEPAATKRGAVEGALLGIVAQGGTTATLVSAGGDDYDFVWAAWGDDTGSPRAVHLALIRRDHGSARLGWSMQQDGYAPTLTTMDGWAFGTRAILLLRYLTGAADAHARLYGMDKDRTPIVLGTFEGSLIEPMTLDGASVIAVHEGAELKTPPTCYGWRTGAHTLSKVACTSAER